jgi:hypothetical protein
MFGRHSPTIYTRARKQGWLDEICGHMTSLMRHRLSSVDPISRRGVCAICGPVDVRLRSSGKKDGRVQWACTVKMHQLDALKRQRESSKKYQAEYQYTYSKEHPVDKKKRDASSWRHKLRNLGLTEDDYNLMLERQQGVCTICGAPPSIQKRLGVDHDHESMKVRGLLCHKCNAALGLLGDSPQTILTALLYLLPHRKSNLDLDPLIKAVEAGNI